MGLLVFAMSMVEFSNNCSTVLPFRFVVLSPQSGERALRSPIMMKGSGSCVIRFWRSFLSIWLFGGRYKEHIVRFVFSWSLAATARSSVLMGSSECAISFLMTRADPPWGPLFGLFTLYIWKFLGVYGGWFGRHVSCRHKQHGFVSSIKVLR